MNLVGKLLIAMPGMGDPRFEHSVIFLCAHSDEGAMGLMVILLRRYPPGEVPPVRDAARYR